MPIFLAEYWICCCSSVIAVPNLLNIGSTTEIILFRKENIIGLEVHTVEAELHYKLTFLCISHSILSPGALICNHVNDNMP